jgi:hypothetical protein
MRAMSSGPGEAALFGMVAIGLDRSNPGQNHESRGQLRRSSGAVHQAYGVGNHIKYSLEAFDGTRR